MLGVYLGDDAPGHAGDRLASTELSGDVDLERVHARHVMDDYPGFPAIRGDGCRPLGIGQLLPVGSDVLGPTGDTVRENLRSRAHGFSRYVGILGLNCLLHTYDIAM